MEPPEDTSRSWTTPLLDEPPIRPSSTLQVSDQRSEACPTDPDATEGALIGRLKAMPRAFWMLFFLILSQDIAWKPQLEVVSVWYDYRNKVCWSGYRWLVSMFYMHSVYVQDFATEGVCHNT